MNKWRQRWYGYTGLHILATLWFPVVVFIGKARDHFGLETFQVSAMSWPAISAFILLLAATLIAQFGLILYAQEHAELEQSRAEAERMRGRHVGDEQPTDLDKSS